MIKPIGSDELQPRYVSDTAEREKLIAEAADLPSVIISSQAAGNAVMMGGGYFNPLKGFMNVADAMGAAEKMTLTDGSFFPVPVMCLLENADAIADAKRIALRDPNVDGNPVLAIMDVEESPSTSADHNAVVHDKSVADISSPSVNTHVQSQSVESVIRSPSMVSPFSTLSPMILQLRFSNSGWRPATYPSSVVQTGVKSFGCEKRTAHPSPTYSWKLMVPCVVSAVKSGAS